MKNNQLESQEHPIILYQVDDTNVCVNVRFENETYWLTQKAMAELFSCTADNISFHLKNIYLEGELDESATTEDSSVVQIEGNREVSRRVIKTGAEIPFTRYFYSYQQPTPSEELAKRFAALEAKADERIKRLFGN